jgi:hypothetical protein
MMQPTLLALPALPHGPKAGLSVPNLGISQRHLGATPLRLGDNSFWECRPAPNVAPQNRWAVKESAGTPGDK